MTKKTTRHQWVRMCRPFANLSPEARGLSIAGGAIALTLIVVGSDALRGTDPTVQVPDTRIAAPYAADGLAVTMPPPVTGGDGPDWTHDRFGSGQGSPDTALPRLAGLAPPEGEGADTRVSRLSRIFRGAPPVVPPERPTPEPHDATGSDSGAAPGPLAAALHPRAQPEAQSERQPQPQQSASLRPRIRPGNLPTASATGDVRRAAPAETRQETETPRQYAVLRPQMRPADLSITPATATDTATDVVTRAAAPAVADAPADLLRQQAALPAAPQIIVPASARCPARLSAAMPRRARNAAGATAVMASLKAVDGVTRDRHVTREILRGNMPDFLRNLRPVSIRGLDANGSTAQITLCVTPDYLALGSDADNVRIPLGLRAATRLGDAFNMLLPTPRMVDLIYRAADVRLSPRPMPAGPQMRSTDYLMRHDATVDAQARRAGAAPGTLISGQKKDVVLTTRLIAKPGRVAIYGWHRANGQPIQPLSTVHGAGYADYSHGVRLVSRTAFLDGKPVDLRSLIASPRYAGLLSDEGPVTGPRLRMAALAAN